ncbi:hypothetical protein [Methylomonas sp. ZR1]|uniref:hypothetical protein n=1 Tax=Methylomonas sp. ZR1 TaxID=1797072 RepID=UPI00149116E6|nr:hypothetical protein [Methylomonas sp. ZR1]NOV29207.1 hypothetical protein [Methylomonas sp. ZR1]
MKKSTDKKPSQLTEIPFGVWVKKGKFDHLYGQSSVALNMNDGACFLNLSCDCGAEPIVLGMNLETLKKVSSGMTRAIAELERSKQGVANVH